MQFFKNFYAQWFGNVRADILAGTVVALALIPEAIAFSLIAGVDPKVGLYASFCIATLIAIVGGRPGMISAATGAMALVMVTLVKEHGIQYLFAATILTGLLQILAGALKLGSLLKFVSKSVMTGFVNALAILIFMAQLPELMPFNPSVYIMVAAGLAIIYLFPFINKTIPSPLVAIVVLTAFAMVTGLDIRTVGDMGDLPSDLPSFLIPDVPFTFETLKIIFPYAATLTAVGLLESLMTAAIVDDMTDTKSNKNIECKGQGFANIFAGFFGGMAGCAMIGQSVINVKSGGRGRLSTFFAGAFLLFLLIVLGDYVKQIPMAAVVSVMIMVSIGTFSWTSIKNLHITPKRSSIVMLSTVAVVVMTHDLAKGVLAGVLLSAFFFAQRVANLFVVHSELSSDKKTRTYHVYGQVFFASSDKFKAAFDTREKIKNVTINLHNTHFWDVTAVSALEAVVEKFRARGVHIDLIGLNEASSTLITRLGFYDNLHKSEKLV